MDIGRRQLLFGGAALGLAAAASEARACSPESESPFSGRFWARRFDLWFALPRREQRLLHGFLEAVMEGSRDRIGRLLAPDAVMFLAPDGTAHWTREPRRLNRGQALDHLAKLVNRTGERNCRIHHSDALVLHSDFIVDATFYGNGPIAAPATGVDAVPALGNYGICGEWIGDSWSRRVVFKLRTLANGYRDPRELQITSLVWMA
jgi:hypothetical protein